jgi:cation-transporting ATPase 13A3/4/5
VFEMTPVGSSRDLDPSYDYTEGASSYDINQALDNTRRARRDSQYSTYYNGDGDVFSGPGQTANPSSVSRMSLTEVGRRSSDTWLSRPRRKSFESRNSHRRRHDSRGSQVSRQSVEGESGYHMDEDEALFSEDPTNYIGRRRKIRRSPSPPMRSSIFGSLAHLFGRAEPAESPVGSRRPSISERSSTSRRSRSSGRSDAGSENALDTDNEEEERWGYSSGEEDSEDNSQHSMEVILDNSSITTSMEYDSEPPSPGETGQTLPLLNLDPVFGEARIEMDPGFTLLEPPPPGLPSRQTIYISDEDSTVRFVGYEIVTWQVWLWRSCCILTFGLLGLLGHWFPYLWLRWVARERAFMESHNGFLVVEVGYFSVVTTNNANPVF